MFINLFCEYCSFIRLVDMELYGYNLHKLFTGEDKCLLLDTCDSFITISGEFGEINTVHVWGMTISKCSHSRRRCRQRRDRLMRTNAIKIT